jgi:hypothetical protein
MLMVGKKHKKQTTGRCPLWIIKTDGSFIPEKRSAFDPLEYERTWTNPVIQKSRMGAAALVYKNDQLVAQKLVAVSGGSGFRAEAMAVALGLSVIVDIFSFAKDYQQDSDYSKKQFLILNDNQSLVNRIRKNMNKKTMHHLPTQEEIQGFLLDPDPEDLSKYLRAKNLKWSPGNRYSLEHRWARLAAQENISDSFLRATSEDLCRREIVLHLEDKRLFHEFSDLSERFIQEVVL